MQLVDYGASFGTGFVEYKCTDNHAVVKWIKNKNKGCPQLMDMNAPKVYATKEIMRASRRGDIQIKRIRKEKGDLLYPSFEYSSSIYAMYIDFEGQCEYMFE